MPEMTTISREEFEKLEARTKKLAMEKSNLALINNMMSRLSSVTGLENTVGNILRIVVDTIGGTNLIVYAINSHIYYTDVYGRQTKIESIDDALVKKAFETREVAEIEHDFSDTKMLTPEFIKTSTCAVPLMVGPEIIGVLKIENMHMSVREVREQFQLFFNYAAIILKNEIQEHTQLKKAHDELNKTNARLSEEIIHRKETESFLLITQFSVDHASDSLFWITPDARFANVNDSTCRRLGYSREELLTMTVFDVDPAFPREAWDAHWQELKERKSFTIETKHKKKSGEVLPVEVTVNYVEYGGAEYNFAFARDISERKRTEEALTREREFSRSLLESMADGVVACDAEGRLTLFNRTSREWHGTDLMRLPPEEWAKNYNLYHSDGMTPLLTEEIPLARAFRGEIVIDAGMAIVARGQAPRFILANGSVIRDAEGKKLGAVVVMRDITELRRIEEALRSTNDLLESMVRQRTAELERANEELQIEIEERKLIEERLEQERNRMDIILSSLNTGLSLINPDMTIAWVNTKIRDMFPGREPVGQICHVFYESRATICDGCGTLQAFMNGEVCESEQLVPATGRWYYIISLPLKDTDGRVVNVLEGITDITKRKRAEDELTKHREHLEELVNERTEEVKKKNAELEKMNKLFVGRELRMVELKQRIKELESKG